MDNPLKSVLTVVLEDGEADINIAGNSASSSLLAMLETHVRVCSGIKVLVKRTCESSKHWRLPFQKCCQVESECF
jgi:hypothetical protein